MGKDVIFRLKESLLFKTLLHKESEENSDNQLSAKVISIITVVAPLLERIPENMPEYTLHDPNHSAKVVENMGKIIPQETLQNFNSIELSLLILSGYLHDIGMTCSKEEKEEIIKNSDEYEILFKSDVNKYEKFKSFKNAGDHRAATFIEDQIFTEYLRRKHVVRSANYIEEKLSSGELILCFEGIPFWKHLVAICNGHGEPVSSLSSTSIWPRHTLIGDRIINVQYLSLILRLADILDLDPERTPKVIYEYVNPKDPQSIIEWQKHRSIIGHSINHRKVLFEAECSSPEVERALKEFMDWIELERQETIKLLAGYQDEVSKKYFLNLNEPLAKDRIRSDGSYISNDLKFEIDYLRVMDLLMGQRLYKNPIVALRELLQNSIDAIKIRQGLFTGKNETFTPIIKIALNESTLSVSDNGVGMNLDIFRNYFLQVGKSFYNSPTFYGRFSDIDVTSEFGIGILSTFMVAHSLIIESRREPENSLTPPEPIHFEIPTAFSYTIQRKSTRTEVGTVITLQLKVDNPFKSQSLVDILEQIIPVPPYPIEVQDYKENLTYKGVEKKDIPYLEFLQIKSITSLEPYLVYHRTPPHFTHKILDIHFNAREVDSELSNIEGKISIVNTNSGNWYTKFNGYLAQRNFNIGLPQNNEEDYKFAIKSSDSLKTLFPDWTSYYSELNLTKSACLSITPDRTDIIVDDKFKKLKGKIEARIIEELRSQFDEIIEQSSDNEFFKYADFLIETGFLGMDLNQSGSVFSKEAKEFFSEYISFPVLDYDGKIRRKRAREIAQCSTIGTVNYNWKYEYINRTIEVIEPQGITLIILPKMEFGIGHHKIDRFISALLGNKDKLTGSHTILTSCLPSFEIKLIKVNNKFRSISNPNDVQAISNGITDKEIPILLIPRQSIELYPIFNASHILIAPLLKENGEYKNKDSEELRNELAKSVHQLLGTSLKMIAEKDSGFSQKLITYGVGLWDQKNYFELTIDILDKDPNLLESLKKIFLKYWKQVKELNLIDSDKEMPEITKRDFLDYWGKN